LIVFDEVQEAESAITFLKCFYENAPEYYIIAAGFFGVMAIHKQILFPAGKVEFLNLYLLNFMEFVMAINE